MKFKSGDIVLVTFKNGIGKIIQDITGEEYGHGFINVDNVSIIEADFFKGVNVSNINKYKGLKLTILRLKNNSGLSLVKETKKYLNYKYDWKSIIFLFFYFMLYKATGLIPNHLINPLNDKNRFYCFELIAKSLKDIGVDFNKDISLITGKELVKKRNVFDIIVIDKFEGV